MSETNEASACEASYFISVQHILGTIKQYIFRNMCLNYFVHLHLLPPKNFCFPCYVQMPRLVTENGLNNFPKQYPKNAWSKTERANMQQENSDGEGAKRTKNMHPVHSPSQTILRRCGGAAPITILDPSSTNFDPVWPLQKGMHHQQQLGKNNTASMGKHWIGQGNGNSLYGGA